MRLSIAGIALLSTLHGAAANEYGLPVLRGAMFEQQASVDVSGFYVGGHIGFASANFDFADTARTLIAHLMRLSVPEEEFDVSTWVSPRDGSGSGSPFGFFMGYNWQSQDSFYGLDLTYSRAAIETSSSDTIARIATSSNEYQYDITVSAILRAKITDLLSLRARGGAIYGSFMPYGTLGVAVARVDLEALVNVSYPTPTDVSSGGGQPALPAFSGSESDSKKGAFAYGFSAGLGFDWLLMPGLFMRGEYEYLAFAPIKDLKISAHIARAGLGARF